MNLGDKNSGSPLLTSDEYLKSEINKSVIKFVLVNLKSLTSELLSKIKTDIKIILVLISDNEDGMAEQRRAFFELIINNVKQPVIIKRSYKNLNLDQFRLFASTDLGSLLIDGFGDGVWAEVENNFISENGSQFVKKFIKEESKEKIINRTLFGILQAARVRISKTEYIACPSCGRTLFDLQETTEMIRKRTEHLKGVKIAIMGCIVNGPGEMADADYGYVGSGVGKITLYREKNIVKRNIPAEDAVDALIQLIKEDEKWVETPVSVN
jgi:(E)-4-hydroxy-3-methylbut-2-enyl-diphosphate synthase